MRQLALAVALGVGCGGGDGAPLDARPGEADAPVDAKSTTTLHLDLRARPVPWPQALPRMVLVDDGTGWRDATRIDDTTYEAEVEGAYRVAVGCDISLRVVYRLASENADLALPCERGSAPLEPIRGTVSPAKADLADPNWFGAGARTERTLDEAVAHVAFGTTYDVAFFDETRIELRRGLTTAQTMHAADLTTAAAKVPHALRIANVAASINQVTLHTTIATAHGAFTSQRRLPLERPAIDTTVHLAPASVLEAGDRETVFVTAYDNALVSLRAFGPASATELALPDAPAMPKLTVTAGAPWQITWTGDPAYDRMVFVALDGRDTVNATVEISRAYAEAQQLDHAFALDLEVGPADAPWRTLQQHGSKELSFQQGTPDVDLREVRYPFYEQPPQD